MFVVIPQLLGLFGMNDALVLSIGTWHSVSQHLGFFAPSPSPTPAGFGDGRHASPLFIAHLAGRLPLGLCFVLQTMRRSACRHLAGDRVGARDAVCSRW
jgi:hypothetical protein